MRLADAPRYDYYCVYYCDDETELAVLANDCSVSVVAYYSAVCSPLPVSSQDSVVASLSYVHVYAESAEVPLHDADDVW